MPQLFVVMHHYVRDCAGTAFPGLKAMSIDAFRAEVRWLCEKLEMASLESALAFLEGRYRPRKDLCLLTFDDGLKDHFAHVLPILSERGIQGLFGIMTGYVEKKAIAPVHKNHLLAATLDSDVYRAAFMNHISELAPDLAESVRVDASEAQRSYPLDTLEVARFKFLLNFKLPAAVCDDALSRLFETHLGSEQDYADDVYMKWSEIRSLQKAGMVIAGHSHRHVPLSSLGQDELISDIAQCGQILRRTIYPQEVWPFSYPYGKRNSYSAAVVTELRRSGFGCAFDTEPGGNDPGADLYALNRIDCNGAIQTLSANVAVNSLPPDAPPRDSTILSTLAS